MPQHHLPDEGILNETKQKVILQIKEKKKKLHLQTKRKYFYNPTLPIISFCKSFFLFKSTIDFILFMAFCCYWWVQSGWDKTFFGLTFWLIIWTTQAMIHVTDNNFKSTKFTYIKLMHNGDISICITYTLVKSYTVCDGQSISSSFIR